MSVRQHRRLGSIESILKPVTWLLVEVDDEKSPDAGGKLTIQTIALKIVSTVLKAFPQFNASVDLEAKEIIYKKYYDIGAAVDTERGLLVPVTSTAKTFLISPLS
jgi:pyruvate/2-oxoglutarate dehydrogenase complex dihydrolipoamide acyltransferase (E2) component